MFGDSKPEQKVKRRMSNIERLNPREEIKFEQKAYESSQAGEFGQFDETGGNPEEKDRAPVPPVDLLDVNSIWVDHEKDDASLKVKKQQSKMEPVKPIQTNGDMLAKAY